MPLGTENVHLGISEPKTTDLGRCDEKDETLSFQLQQIVDWSRRDLLDGSGSGP